MELNYKVFGQGPPVIILHGMLGMLDNWQVIAKKLSDHFMVFIVDQRNHGKSPHTDEMSYELMAEDLMAFMQEHWIHRAHILGHSMGGKTAMYFAITNPDMVEKLVVVDIGVSENQPAHEPVFQALLSVSPEEAKSRKEADEILKKMVPDFRIRQFLMKNLGRNDQGLLAWKMNLKSIYEHYKNMLAAVPAGEPFEGQTLFLRGGLSDYVKASDMNSIREIFPKARLAIIEDAGHWVHADAPEEFFKILLEFFNT